MRNFIDLIENLDGAVVTKTGRLQSYLTEAQDYSTILNPLRKIDPELSPKYEKEITEIRRIMKRVDRIVWFLRIWRMNVIYREYEKGNKKLHKDVLADFASDYKKRVGPITFADISNILEQIPQFQHFLSLPIPNIQNLRFVGQTPTNILDAFKAAEEAYNEGRRDERNPLRRINHAQPPTRNGTPHNCSRCDIDARRPETWGNCAAREKTAIDFGNGLRWVILDSVACAREAEAMIHCGNEGAPADGDRILSLRQAETKNGVVVDIPHLTFILHANGDLGEMKAPENNRPGKRWHKQILRLILSPMVTGLRGGNYLAQNDFTTSQLSSEDFQTLLKQKPDVLELPALWKLVSEKKLPFTPAVARRIAKADGKVIDYAYQHMPWNRETIGAFIGGGPTVQWVVPMLKKIIPDVQIATTNPEQRMRAIFAEHPELFGIIGEQNLLPFIKVLGASRFSEDALAHITPHQAASVVHSREDMARLPETIRNNVDFIRYVTGISHLSGSGRLYGIDFTVVDALSETQLALLSEEDLLQIVHNRDVYDRLPPQHRDDPEFRYKLVRKNPRAVDFLSPYISDDELHDMMLNMAGRIIAFVPKERLTTEMVDAGLPVLGYGDLRYVPENIMSPAAREKYWTGRVANDRTLHLKDVPEDYRTPSVMVATLGEHPQDIAGFANRLDDSTVVRLLQKTKFSALNHMPESLKTEAVAKALGEAANKDEGLRRFYKVMPSKFMTRAGMEYLVKSDGINFDAIPEHLRDEQTIRYYYQNNTGRGTDKWRTENLPLLQRYVTPEIAEKLVSDLAYSLRNIPSSAITDDVVIAAINNLKGTHAANDWLVDMLTKNGKRLSGRVIEALVAHGMMRIADIPSRLLTPDAVLLRLRYQRVGDGKAEGMKDIPAKLLTEDLVIRLIVQNPAMVKQVPARLRTANVLEAWLRTFGDRSATQVSSHHHRSHDDAQRLETFKMFPKSAWTSDALAMAINLRILPPDLSKIPATLQDTQVKRAVLAHRPDLLDQTDVDDEELASAVGRNIKVLERLSPDQITEPVAYAAMAAFASQGRGKFQGSTRDALLRIPKNVWSERVWRQAVGYIASLDQVPEEYRNDLMMQVSAVQRDPTNIAHVPNAAKWLAANWDSFHRTDADFRLLLERGGLVKTKKGFADVRELPREVLAGGYTTAEMSAGPVNKRAYLFDPDGRYVFALYSEKGQIRFLRRSDDSYRTLPDAERAQTVRALLPLMAKKHFPDMGGGDLYLARIFGNYGRTTKLEEELERKGIVGHLKWSEGNHETGTLYTAWLNDEPIIRIDVGSRGAGMSSGLRDVDVLSRSKCMQHIDEIADKVERLHLFWNSELGTLGLRVERGKLQRVAGPLVAKFGKLEVRRAKDGKFLSLFGPKGLLGYGRPTAGGDIRSVTTVYGIHDDDLKRSEGEIKLTEILAKVSLALKRGTLAPPAA